METRKGRQTPTVSLVLPYEKSHGAEAVELYNSTGKECQEWQELLLYDILAVNEDEEWTHSVVGYSVPRRNGKNEILAIREMYGLMAGEQIIHTAHRTSTSHAAWERLCALLDKAEIEYHAIKALGQEYIDCSPDGGRIFFRTRTSKGGLGEGFDLLVIDEAQEYQDDQESTLKYVVSASPNPQTIMCGTPPTPISSGTVFTKLRKDTLSGNHPDTMWAEWSVEFQSDPNDVDLWYETNPSLGTLLKERNIRNEIGTDKVDFNIQRLGLWIRYNQKSAITRDEWESLACEELPAFNSKLFVGIKYGHDNQNVAMSIALKTKDNNIFVESIDCRPIKAGNQWILDFLCKAQTAAVVVDGASGQEGLKSDMKDAHLKTPILPTVKQIIAANSAFEQAIGQRMLCHKNQPSLTQAVSNCETRAIGSNGGFGYRSIKEGVDIALLDSVILATWAAREAKERKPQRMSY